MTSVISEQENSNKFLVLFALFVFVLPIGNLLWVPLLVMCGLGAVYVYKLTVTQTQPSRDEKSFFLVFGAFFVPALLSVYSSADVERTLNYLLTLPLFSLAGLYAFVSLRCSSSLAVTARVVLGLVIVAFVAQLWEFLDPASPFGHGTEGRYHGFFASSFGGNLKLPVIAVALCMFCTGVFVEERSKWLIALTSFVMIAIVVLSGTRMVWLSLVYLVGFVLIAGLIFKGKNSLKYLVPVILVLASIVGGSIVVAKNTMLMDRVNQSFVMFTDFNYQNVNYALSNRLPMWEATIRMGIDNPYVGTGANAWRYAYPAYVPEGSTGDLVELDLEQRPRGLYLFPHQHVLEVFASAGIIGLIGLLVFYITLLKLTIRAYQMGNAAAFFTALGLCSYFFPVNTHHAIYSSWITGWLWLWVGIVFGLLNRTPPNASGFAKR